VTIGSITIGGGRPVAVQSMCATKTRDVKATVRQAEALRRAGAGIVRIAVDSDKDAAALEAIAGETEANLSVDLQETYRLAAVVAPFVHKIRYNPGHLYHHERSKPVEDKLAFLADAAAANDCAMRIGVNCGSVDPTLADKVGTDSVEAMVASALEHSEMLEKIGFTRYCVSLKDSDPAKVIEANRRFAARCPEVPLHLGVTEAGLPPEGIVKTRTAFEHLLSRGIGDTIRVSLTLPHSRKHEEVEAGLQILADVAAGRSRVDPDLPADGLNIISCPSCSRVENEEFVRLATRVREATRHVRDEPITIAVMGCRVNGPGETDDADLGLWCAPRFVNLKRGGELVGAFPYEEILPRFCRELERLIRARRGSR